MLTIKVQENNPIQLNRVAQGSTNLRVAKIYWNSRLHTWVECESQMYPLFIRLIKPSEIQCRAKLHQNLISNFQAIGNVLTRSK